MQWKNERRLVFGVGVGWHGYFCERCCWNLPRPEDPGKLNAYTKRASEEFAAHDCEQFARENWKATREGLDG
jgi:hypothetical protein